MLIYLGKNLSNFVPPIWKLHDPYCDTLDYLIIAQYGIDALDRKILKKKINAQDEISKVNQGQNSDMGAGGIKNGQTSFMDGP